MKTYRIFLTLVAAMLVACGGGTLYNIPQLDNYDFKYIHELTKPYSALYDSKPLVLSAKYEWDGRRGEEILLPQHTVLAYTQETVTNKQNTSGEQLWTHGAGALVSDIGLVIELWYREDANGNGLDDDTTNAVVWSQDNNRCVQDVLGTINVVTDCLSDKKNEDGYITPAPNFVLRKGIPYFLRTTIYPELNNKSVIEAELFMNGPMGMELVQSGRVRFDTNKHFPMVGHDLKAAVAKTPGSEGEPAVQYAVLLK